MRMRDREYRDISMYKDMLTLPHHVSKNHVPMDMYERAAQFSPFQALTGYKDAVQETARLTDRKIELDEDQLRHLDERFRELEELLPGEIRAKLEYFAKDERKEGGEYRFFEGIVKRIDGFERVLLFRDGSKIALDDILTLEIEKL